MVVMTIDVYAKEDWIKVTGTGDVGQHKYSSLHGDRASTTVHPHNS